MEAASGQLSSLGILFGVRGNGSGVSSQGRIDPGVQPGAGLESTVPMLLPETSIDGRVLPLPSVLLGSPRTAPQGGQEIHSSGVPPWLTRFPWAFPSLGSGGWGGAQSGATGLGNDGGGNWGAPETALGKEVIRLIT